MTSGKNAIFISAQSASSCHAPYTCAKQGGRTLQIIARQSIRLRNIGKTVQYSPNFLQKTRYQLQKIAAVTTQASF
jgi:hypothetical protein